MKAIKLLTAASLLATVSTSAFADQTIHIGGSTAFRAAVHNAVVHLMTAGGNTCHVAFNGSSLAGANQAVFQGTVAGLSGTTTIETAWNGSITGIAGLVVSSEKFAFMLPSNITTGTATASTQPNNPGTSQFSNFGLLPGPSLATGSSGTTSATETVAPDIALSDAFVSSTPFKSTNGFAAVNDVNVGIIPFTWMKNAALSSDTDFAGWQRLTNISTLQAKFLFTSGIVSGSDLTGNAADGFIVSLAGRDYDSGTRFDALAEAASAGTTQILQFGDSPAGSGVFKLASGSGVTSVVSSTPGANVQIQSTLSTTLPANGGFNSGGKLDAAMQATGTDAAPDFGGYVVCYTGASDADTVLGVTSTGGNSAPAGYNTPTALTFNGVSLSKANVANGTYSFWTFEHYLTPTSISGTTATFSTALFNQLKNTDAAVAGYKISDLAPGVSRSVEGGVISLP